MFLLALHIVSIGILVMMVWAIAHGQGRRAGERQLRRRLGLDAQTGAPAPAAAPAAQAAPAAPATGQAARNQ